MTMIMIGSSMPKTEHDLKAIMYPAYDTNIKLRTTRFRGNKIQVSQNPPEW